MLGGISFESKLLLVSIVQLAFFHQAIGLGIVQTLLEFSNRVIDCYGLIDNNTDWLVILDQLELQLPMDFRSRCFMYCFLRKTGVIMDEMGLIWNDVKFFGLTNMLIKSNERKEIVMKSFYRCRNLPKAFRMSESRCNNTLMFMLCFRSTGSSFSLSDSVAMNVHAAFKKEQQTQLAVIENYVRKSKLLKSKTKATTFSPIPDQTELDTNVAANFWNAFRGKPRLITEGCGPLLR